MVVVCHSVLALQGSSLLVDENMMFILQWKRGEKKDGTGRDGTGDCRVQITCIRKCSIFLIFSRNTLTWFLDTLPLACSPESMTFGTSGTGFPCQI